MRVKSRAVLSATALAALAAVATPGLEAQRDTKSYYPKPLKISVPATQGQMDQLWNIHDEALRLKRVKAGGTIPLWDLYTGAADLVSNLAGTEIKRGNLCREAMSALAGITGTTNRQKWTDVEITYVPPVGSTSKPYTVKAFVFFTAAYTGGKIRVHFEDENGKVIPGLEEECVNSKITPYGGE